MPPVPGVDAPNVFRLWTVPDMDRITGIHRRESTGLGPHRRRRFHRHGDGRSLRAARDFDHRRGAAPPCDVDHGPRVRGHDRPGDGNPRRAGPHGGGPEEDRPGLRHGAAHGREHGSCGDRAGSRGGEGGARARARRRSCPRGRGRAAGGRSPAHLRLLHLGGRRHERGRAQGFRPDAACAHGGTREPAGPNCRVQRAGDVDAVQRRPRVQRRQDLRPDGREHRAHGERRARGGFQPGVRDRGQGSSRLLLPGRQGAGPQGRLRPSLGAPPRRTGPRRPGRGEAHRCHGRGAAREDDTAGPGRDRLLLFSAVLVGKRPAERGGVCRFERLERLRAAGERA